MINYRIFSSCIILQKRVMPFRAGKQLAVNDVTTLFCSGRSTAFVSVIALLLLARLRDPHTSLVNKEDVRLINANVRKI